MSDRVPGCGPSDAEIVFCGEYPGAREVMDGEPFVGRTSRDFNKLLLPMVGLQRRDVFLTNLYREYRPKGQSVPYTKEEYEADLDELRGELGALRPKLVVSIGAEATRYFLGSDADLDEVHGILWRSPSDDWAVFPTAHIAAYTPDQQARVWYDFGQLKAVVQAHTLNPRRMYEDPFPTPTYLDITDAGWVSCLRGVSHLSIDTEGRPGRGWSVQFCVQPGTAYMVRVASDACLRAFLRWLLAEQPTITFHGSLHDLGIFYDQFRRLGLDVEALYDLRFEDTQVMAYLLQLEPRGLKPNCVRHCGMRMMDYTDVMGDVQAQLAQDYLLTIYDAEQHDYEVRAEAELARINASPLVDAHGHPKRRKDGSIRYHRLTKPPSVPKTRLHKASLRVLSSARSYGLWLDQDEDIQVAGYDLMRGEIPEASLDDVDYKVAKTYACRDADGTERLRPHLRQRMDALDLESVYRLELSTYPLIHRMMMVGMLPDLEHFKKLSDKLEGEIARLRESLEVGTGHAGFNANSGDQVSDYLFGELALPEYKRTSPDGRPSTNDKILEALEHEFGVEIPAIGGIRSFRETYKLKHTFVDRIPDFVARYPHDGRVHATFRTTTVVSGRLSASDPNVLAQPEHGTFAADFKRGWIAAPGHVVAAWDESQIELRVLAHLSRDEYLLRAYRDGIDLHAALAHRIFGVAPKDQDKHKHRLPAKAINFGIPMGMQEQGLTLELRKNGLDITQQDAADWLAETEKIMPGVVSYKKAMIAQAKQNGYIRCLSGRIRYVGGIKSWDDRIRAEAERFAFSTPIQEGAQWVMKQAEAELWQVLCDYRRRGRWVEPLLQQHDALKLEMEDGLQWEFNDIMRALMIDVVDHCLCVPLDVEGEWGYNFGDMERFKEDQ